MEPEKVRENQMKNNIQWFIHDRKKRHSHKLQYDKPLTQASNNYANCSEFIENVLPIETIE